MYDMKINYLAVTVNYKTKKSQYIILQTHIAIKRDEQSGISSLLK